MTLRLLQATLAHWRQARTLTVLTVLGVALGVASVVCIQIINQGSLAAFAGSMQAVSGEADLVVRGQGPDLDESRYPEVLAHPDVAAAWPLVRAWARLSGRDAYLDVVGVDVFAPVRYPVALADRAGPLGGVAAMLTEPGWVALTPSLADELDLAVGDTLTVAAADRLEIGRAHV